MIFSFLEKSCRVLCYDSIDYASTLLRLLERLKRPNIAEHPEAGPIVKKPMRAFLLMSSTSLCIQGGPL